MQTIMEQVSVDQTLRIRRNYSSEWEKKLMVDNLRLAVEYFGKDHLRKEFKNRKKKNTFDPFL